MFFQKEQKKKRDKKTKVMRKKGMRSWMVYLKRKENNMNINYWRHNLRSMSVGINFQYVCSVKIDSSAFAPLVLSSDAHTQMVFSAKPQHKKVMQDRNQD